VVGAKAMPKRYIAQQWKIEPAMGTGSKQTSRAPTFMVMIRVRSSLKLNAAWIHGVQLTTSKLARKPNTFLIYVWHK
jgi:hypothetical protein